MKVTNFGEYFDVKSKPNPNDLAYKPIALPPHTDNPYRKPAAPGIQFLHCLENEVSGGFSTLVDGFAVAEYLRNKHTEAFESLITPNLRYQFQDKDIVYLKRKNPRKLLAKLSYRFIKKNIGTYEDQETITLDAWINSLK